jgi:polyhydroxyalkanoate synthase
MAQVAEVASHEPLQVAEVAPREPPAATGVGPGPTNVVGNPLIWLGLRHALSASARLARRLAERPGAVARETRQFAAELGRIALDRPGAVAIPRDRRFDDPAWAQHPAYRRLGRSYFALAAYLQRLVDASELDPKSALRARFVVGFVADALAPTNTVWGNPAALRRAAETRGASLARGARRLAHDVRHNHGLPTQVDKAAFAVGRNLAVTPGAVVYRDEVLELIQYRPRTPTVSGAPVVFLPPQINKYYVLDLAPGRSFIDHMVGRGIDFFAVSWRNPTAAQRHWGMGEYVAAARGALDAARSISGSGDAHLLGMCAGGLTTSVLLAHLAAKGLRHARTATFAVTAFDRFKTPAMGTFTTRPIVASLVERSRRRGVMHGWEIARGYASLRANDLLWKHWVNLYLLGNDPPAFDTLYWSNDTTRVPAALHEDFVRFYLDNALTRRGAVSVLGTPIDLRRVEVDTYLLAGLGDDITPWRASYETTQLVGGRCEFVLSSGGHAQSMVNPPGGPKARYFAGGQLGADPDAWLRSAREHKGSWWDHWADWVLARSGPSRPAPPQPGNAQFAPLDAAPGRYVHER